MDRRTTLLLLRHRIHLVTTGEGREQALLAEDTGLIAFTGTPSTPQWLDGGTAELLLQARPSGNVDPGQATHVLREVLVALGDLRPYLDAEGHQRAERLLETHRRVRQSAGMPTRRLRVEAQLPPDVLGVYVFLPQPAAH